MLRVGYLVPDWPNQTHAFFWREVCALRELGLDVHLISTRRPGHLQCGHAFAEEARRSTFYVFPVPLRHILLASLKYFVNIGLIASYVRSLRESSYSQRLRVLLIAWSAAGLARESQVRRLDHIHVHSFGDAAHLVALANLLGGPDFSITLHGDLPVYGVDHETKVRGASFLSAVTKPLKRQIVESLGFPESRVAVIAMGVDTNYFCAGLEKRKNPEFTLVTVARLNPTKGHCYVLEAMKRCIDMGASYRYIIAGDGPHKDCLLKKTQALGIESCVSFVGNVSEQEVLRLLRISDAFVLASEGLGEAAPVSVMEAMACGLPVICSRIGGTTYMIKDGVDGLLVNQGDVSGLAEAIFKLADGEEIRERIGKAARNTARNEFDFRIAGGKLSEQIHKAH